MTIRDSAGKKKFVPTSPDQPEIVVNRPSLRILDQDLWERAQLRWRELDEKYRPKKAPRKKGRRQPKHYTEQYPVSFLSGCPCDDCGGEMRIYHSDGTRYLRCMRGVRGCCKAKTGVPVAHAEKIVLDLLCKALVEVPQWLQTTITQMNKRIEEAAREVPTDLQRQRDQLKVVEEQIDNLMALAERSKSPTLAARLDSLESEHASLSILIAEGEELAAVQKFVVSDEDWTREELKQLSQLLRTDPDANRLIKTLLGKVSAREVIPPGKKRGHLQLSIRIDGNTILAACLKKTLPPALLAKLTVAVDDATSYTITLDLERQTDMSRICPTIHELRSKGVPWREIEKIVGKGHEVASQLYRVWLRRQKPAA